MELWDAPGTPKPAQHSRANGRRTPRPQGLLGCLARGLAAAAVALAGAAHWATVQAAEPGKTGAESRPVLRLLQAAPAADSGSLRIAPEVVQALACGGPTRLELDLPGCGRRVIRLHPATAPTRDRALFAGCIEEAPGSHAIVSLRNTSLAGSLHLPGVADFALVPQPGGFLRIERVDPGAIPACGVRQTDAERAVYRRAARLQGEPPPPPNPGGGEPVILDLLVVYTPAARVGAGGSDGIAAEVDTAVADMNRILENSQVPARVRLMETREVDYRETGHAEEDLANLTEAAEHDGKHEDDDHQEDEEAEDWAALKPVPELRRQLGADLVCLVVETSEETAGVANQMWRPERSFATKALSVVQRTFLNRYHVMAHEIGHNLGCQHDRAPGTMPGAFPFSYGYRFPAGGIWYRDVMATGPGISVPHFSNPLVNYLGVPTGVAADQPNAADNALTLSITTPVAALFGESLVPPPPAIRLVNPAPGSAFALPAVVELEAEIEGELAGVAGVAFYAGDRLIGNALRPPFKLPWTNVIAGEFALRAEVTMTGGGTNHCEPTLVRFSKPPSVRLTSPDRDGWVPRDTRLECRADASDPDGHIVRVEFYADEYLVGVALAPPFSVAWTNVWGNRYVMTARATDDMGVSTTSAPVTLGFTPRTTAFDLLTLKPDDDGRIGFKLAGPAGRNCTVEVSEDLQNWRPLVSLELEAEPREIRDADAAPRGARFYRIKPE